MTAFEPPLDFAEPPLTFAGRPHMRAVHTWASGHVSASNAGHMTAFEPSPRASKARLNPQSRLMKATSEERRPTACTMIFSLQTGREALRPKADRFAAVPLTDCYVAFVPLNGVGRPHMV